MKRLLLSIMIIAGSLHAEGFESFLNRAVENSSFLKASHLRIAQTSQAGKVLTRYENPDLELEASYFDPDMGGGESGYRAGIAQPIRLWGISGSKDALAAANTLLEKSNYVQVRAAFIRDISLQYTRYAEDDLFMMLAFEESALAQKIYAISKARYEAGTIARGVMLQARVDAKMVQAKRQGLDVAKKRSYYKLLRTAGINEAIELDTDYAFVFEISQRNNPELLQLENAQKSALASAELNTNKVEWMHVVAEYENEPDQDIYRLGASFPLAFFNTRSEEKQIAVLETTRTQMLSQNVQTRMELEMKRLQFESESLRKLKEIDLVILEDQRELLAMFEDAYKIANVNLLALQDIKSRLVETKGRLIKIKIELDRNAIERNYLQGNYND